MNQYAFILGREYKLSLAELVYRFGAENLTFHNEIFAIFTISNAMSHHEIHSLGGSIRIIKIIKTTTRESFPTDVIEILKADKSDAKITFALAAFGTQMPLSEMGLRMKKSISSLPVRLINTKNENIHSAVFKKEKLAKTQNEFCCLLA